jgi:hypothetical protein
MLFYWPVVRKTLTSVIAKLSERKWNSVYAASGNHVSRVAASGISKLAHSYIRLLGMPK